ncbi:MAG: hypothetical protein BGN88_14355 [Clostridiales bacterium 43-6]|nr:MAG: hypothetical protein BGN88_14355 [Clostridiales bacterium 43-6]
MLVTLLFTMTKQLHLLQLNSYFNKRFLEYLFTADYKNAVLALAVFSVSLVLIFVSPLGLFILVTVTGIFRILSTIRHMKKAKKKISYTARIKRMYGTALTLSALSLTAAKLFLYDDLQLMLYCFAVSLALIASPFFTMAINLINTPVEKAIAQYYISDAKKILRSMPGMKVIGITGSYGKTSTKYILGRLLLEKYNVTFTPESYNTLMGVVRTVRERLKSGTQVFVVEMGAKKPGDIKEICDLVKPDMGIITSVGPQHLNTFKSVENIIKTKFELSDAVIAKGGLMFFNHDNAYIKEKAKDLSGVRFSQNNPSCDVHAENIAFGRFGLSFDICTKGRRISVTTKLLGNHNILNILAAAAVGIELGLKDIDIKFAVSQLTAVPHRLEMKPFTNGSLLIDDAYNANPEGSAEAVKVLGSFSGMKRIIITPGLVELGEKEYECNFNLGRICADHCDIIILVGAKRSVPLAEGVKSGNFTEENLHVMETFQDALAFVRSICDKNTVVLFENDLPDNYAK